MTQCAIDEARVYPAPFHFRIIVHADSQAHTSLATTLADYRVVEPLASGNSSGSGRYLSLNVTVHLESRDEHQRLHTAIRNTAGVRLLL